MGFALGATDYMTKPVDWGRLASLVKHAGKGESGPVLVVDDDLGARERMGRMLTKEGWQVATAENGRVALEVMSGAKPALILLDLMMPVMDGFDFLSQIRRHPEWQRIPVIVLTAKDLTADDRKRLNGRVREILLKGSCGREQLLREVRELIST